MTKLFVLRLWISSIVIAPVLLKFSISSFDFSYFIQIFLVFLLFSIPFSIPAVLVVFIIGQLLEKTKLHPITIRVLIVTISVCAASFSLHLVGGSMIHEVMIAYSSAILLSGITLIIMFNKKTKPNNS